MGKEKEKRRDFLDTDVSEGGYGKKHLKLFSLSEYSGYSGGYDDDVEIQRQIEASIQRENQLRSSARNEQKQRQREYWAEIEAIDKNDLGVSGERKRLLTSSGMFREVNVLLSFSST